MPDLGHIKTHANLSVHTLKKLISKAGENYFACLKQAEQNATFFACVPLWICKSYSYEQNA